MPPEKELKDLAERKRLLLSESALHRALLAADCERLRLGVGSLGAVRKNLSGIGPWLLAGSAVAGLLAARRWRKLLRWLPPALPQPAGGR